MPNFDFVPAAEAIESVLLLRMDSATSVNWPLAFLMQSLVLFHKPQNNTYFVASHTNT
jgi:hypothetical protein